MRIFIDCSYIDFGRQPTGIPRVVLKYVEGGYRWFRKSGIEVVPVVVTPRGLIAVRPVPGVSPPDYMRPYLNELHGHGGSVEVEHQLQLATHHLQAAIVQQAAMTSQYLTRLSLECRQHIERGFDDYLKEYTATTLDVNKGDVLFCPAYWHDIPPEYFTRLQDLGCKIVTLVHDILPITLPKFYQSPWKFQFEKNVVSALKNSDVVMAVSKYSADSLREIVARKGLRPVHIYVAYNGFDPLTAGEIHDSITSEHYYPIVARHAEIELMRRERPFLMVGSLEPKKGHIPVVRSFEALWEAGLKRPLVIVGRPGWMHDSVVHAVKGSSYFNKKLFWFDDFDDVDLSCGYQFCRGLLFSSYAEGFGIPMVEALSAQRPVVAYDTQISREVIGKHGLFFSNFVKLAQHIAYLDSDDGFALECQRAASFSWPSWQTVANELFEKLAALGSVPLATVSERQAC